MATASPQYGSTTALTMTLASLASSATLVTGRQSSVVNNNSDDAIDALVGGKVTTGTSPAASGQIEVWLFGSYDDAEFSGGAGGGDSALTPDAKSLLRLLTVIPTVNTSNKAYRWGPFSVAKTFDGVMPEQWGVFIVHNTGVNLNATGGNHAVVYTPIKYESA